MSATPVPLRRTPSTGVIAGVCSGFAARLGIDPILIRIGFVLTLAAGGCGGPTPGNDGPLGERLNVKVVP